jgi:hypothetical protein
VRAPELCGRRSAPRAIADLRLRPNNYRGPIPEMGAICNISKALERGTTSETLMLTMTTWRERESFVERA